MKAISNTALKRTTTALLLILAIASFVWSVLADGMMSLIGLISAIFAVIALLDANTDYVKNY